MDKPTHIVIDSENMKRLKGMIEECVDHLVHMDALREKIKDIKQVAKDEFKELGVTSSQFNKLVARVHKGDARKQNDELTEVLDTLEALGYYSQQVGY